MSGEWKEQRMAAMFLLRADSLPEERGSREEHVLEALCGLPVNRAAADTKWTARHGGVRATTGVTSTSVIREQARVRKRETEGDVNCRRVYFQFDAEWAGVKVEFQVIHTHKRYLDSDTHTHTHTQTGLSDVRKECVCSTRRTVRKLWFALIVYNCTSVLSPFINSVIKLLKWFKNAFTERSLLEEHSVLKCASIQRSQIKIWSYVQSNGSCVIVSSECKIRIHKHASSQNDGWLSNYTQQERDWSQQVCWVQFPSCKVRELAAV